MKRFDMADWAEQLLGNMVKANERAAAARAAERRTRTDGECTEVDIAAHGGRVHAPPLQR